METPTDPNASKTGNSPVRNKITLRQRILHHSPLRPLYRGLRDALGLRHNRLLICYGTSPRIRHAWEPVGGKQAIHRYYTEQFLAANAAAIRGHCLEFQEDSYGTRFSGDRLEKLDILHVDESSEHATIIADLTKPNQIPDNRFDCIICTFVLHCIPDAEAALRDMRRILKPGGVLLGCTPLVMGYTPNCGEMARFTPEGLDHLMTRSFEPAEASIQTYGNSLTAMADVRGLASEKFSKDELDFHDPEYPVIVTFRGLKSGGP